MSAGATPDLSERLRRLRLQGEFAKARTLIRAQKDFGKLPALQRLLYEHEDFWWEPIVGKRVTLRRRGPDDVAFVRACWADADFMHKFNRLARPLPASDVDLRAVLAREHAGIWSEARGAHWTIHNAAEPIGFISATDYAAGHRRCEYLIGLLKQPASPAPMEAVYLSVKFLREKIGIERLTGYYYAENEYAAKVGKKVGFHPEGVLKGYLRNPDGSRSDLVVSGLLLTDAAEPVAKQAWDRFCRMFSR